MARICCHRPVILLAFGNSTTFSNSMHDYYVLFYMVHPHLQRQ